jgi:FkbM family methyltransferase
MGRTLKQRIQRAVGFQLVRRFSLEQVQWMQTRALLRHLMHQLDINCVLDVGANEGQFGVALRGAGYQGWILSFEPVSEIFGILQHQAKGDELWRAFPFALGATNEQAEINVGADSLLSSFLEPREDSLERFPANRVTRTETVEVRRLDDTLDECLAGIAAPRIYLKMDTQGFDLEVVKGGERTLPRIVALQTEVSFRPIYRRMPNFLESIGTLQALGFEVIAFEPVSTDSDLVRAVEMDCVMARALPTARTP